MKRLTENTVFLGLVTCWCFATCPTSISPFSVKPTTDGVSRLPWHPAEEHAHASVGHGTRKATNRQPNCVLLSASLRDSDSSLNALSRLCVKKFGREIALHPIRE